MAEAALSTSQIVVQVCLFVVAAIALFGGALQMVLGQPDTSPRLDNVHRFMAGVYFSTGLISLWAAITIRQQGFLVYLLALGVLLRRQRWPVAYLGQTVPMPDLAAFVRKINPPAVVLVAMTPESAHELAEWPRWFPGAKMGRPAVAFGGRIFTEQAEWRESAGDISGRDFAGRARKAAADVERRYSAGVLNGSGDAQTGRGRAAPPRRRSWR